MCVHLSVSQHTHDACTRAHRPAAPRQSSGVSQKPHTPHGLSARRHTTPPRSPLESVGGESSSKRKRRTGGLGLGREPSSFLLDKRRWFASRAAKKTDELEWCVGLIRRVMMISLPLLNTEHPLPTTQPARSGSHRHGDTTTVQRRDRARRRTPPTTSKVALNNRRYVLCPCCSQQTDSNS